MPPSKGNPQKQDLAAAKKARAKQQAKPPAKKGKAKGPSAAVQALLNDPAAFTAPQTYGQAIAEGGRVADLTYGPQIAQVQLQQRQAPAWFDQYRASLQTPQQVQTAYAPAIQAVNANAAETAQATPGIDPNSEAGKTDALAAKAREALVHLGASTLTAQQNATSDYYQGRQGVANAAQIGANTQLSSQLGSLRGQRGAAVAQYVGQARQQERGYGLSQQHQRVENAAFGVKQQSAQTSVDLQKARLRSSNRQQRANRRATANKPITSGPFAGFTPAQVNAMSPAEKQKYRDQKTSTASPKPRFTPEQTAKSNATLRKAVALVQQGRKLPTGGAPEYWRQAFDQLVQDGMDPAVARAAVQLVRVGRVGPNTRKTLKNDYGIVRFPKKPKRKKPPGSSSGGGGGPHGTGRP
jgi:hypothetical protein